MPKSKPLSDKKLLEAKLSVLSRFIFFFVNDFSQLKKYTLSSEFGDVVENLQKEVGVVKAKWHDAEERVVAQEKVIAEQKSQIENQQKSIEKLNWENGTCNIFVFYSRVIYLLFGNSKKKPLFFFSLFSF